MSNTSLQSQTRTRRFLLAVFPRKPRTHVGRVIMYRAACKVYSIADWLAGNAEYVMLEIEAALPCVARCGETGTYPVPSPAPDTENVREAYTEYQSPSKPLQDLMNRRD